MSALNKIPGLINFYDNCVPSLKSGQYKITLSQELTAAPPPAPNTQPLPAEPQAAVTQTFLVNGPRFSIPPADINHVFPASNSTGVFDTVIPQIVLNEEKLPWERNLNLNPVQTNIPWMALLVFSGDELPDPPSSDRKESGNQQNPTKISTRLLNDVLINASYGNGGKTTGPPSGTLGPANLNLEANEDPNTTWCKTIDIPVNIFNALAPSLQDATFLAHTREVSMLEKAADAGQNGMFSVVIANRFSIPPSGTLHSPNANIAHLVSLEGFESWLSTQPAITDYNTIRMISLYSWSFGVQADPLEDFGELMNQLISTPKIGGTDLLLRMPPVNPITSSPIVSVESNSPGMSVAEKLFILKVKHRINQGYVALGYQMQAGDQSFAWYRGPFSAVPVGRFMKQTTGSGNPLTPYSTADAMIFDPATGIFDQSYAVAFQTGRSLALASQSFTTSLVGWRKTSHGVVDLLLEYMTGPYRSKMLQDNLINGSGQLTAQGISGLAAILNAYIVTGAFTDFLATTFYRDLATSIGRNGGFTSQDNSLVIQEAPDIHPGPSDLNDLMHEPVIRQLLQHLSGFDSLGVLSSPMVTGDTTISLLSPGISEALPAGAELVLYTPDGKSSVLVTVTNDVTIGDTLVTISSYTGVINFPSRSTLQISDSNPDAKVVVNWLASLSLLHNVPFNNIVANPDLLPQETIRFFYLDRNWTDALLEGAMSIGVQSSRDALFNQLMRDSLHAKVEASMAEVRDALLGRAGEGQIEAITKPAGFLLRSKAIASYPGLEVTAMVFDSTGKKITMKPLRLDRLGTDLLVAIYPDIPVEISFSQPSEGLVFGVVTANHSDQKESYLRYVPGVTGCTAENIGNIINISGEPLSISFGQIQKASFRAGTLLSFPPAMNIAGSNGLVGLIESHLPSSPAVSLTPASFGVEMVRVPEQMVFTPKLYIDNAIVT